jgi:proteic killer suppression protein
MLISFKNTETEDVYEETKSAAARKLLPQNLWRVAHRKLTVLNHATRIGELNVPPANRLEKLKGKRLGQYSIRINDQYRICFRWTEEGPSEVEIVDYH